MELWIRSQEKTILIKANNILMRNFDDGSYGIQINDGCFVGEYKSRERAEEILNEIQNLIQPTFITTGYDCKCKENPFDKLSFNLEMAPTKTEVKELSTYVYEMPEK